MTNLNFIKEFFLVLILQTHTRNAPCRNFESILFFIFLVSAPLIAWPQSTEANQTPLAFRLCDDRFSSAASALSRVDLWHLSNSEDPHWQRTEAELHARWFFTTQDALGIRLGASSERFGDEERQTSLKSPALFVSHRQKVAPIVDLALRAELEFESFHRSMIATNAIVSPFSEPFKILIGGGVDASGMLMTQLGFRYGPIEGSHLSRGDVSYSRLTTHYGSLSLSIQAPISWTHPEENREYAIRFGITFGENATQVSTSGDEYRNNKANTTATVLDSQPAFHLFLIDRGSNADIQVGQEFDVFDIETANDPAFDPNHRVARAHVTHLQENRAILLIDEYRIQKTIEAGFRIRAVQPSSPKRIAAPQ